MAELQIERVGLSMGVGPIDDLLRAVPRDPVGERADWRDGIVHQARLRRHVIVPKAAVSGGGNEGRIGVFGAWEGRFPIVAAVADPEQVPGEAVGAI